LSIWAIYYYLAQSATTVFGLVILPRQGDKIQIKLTFIGKCEQDDKEILNKLSKV